MDAFLLKTLADAAAHPQMTVAALAKIAQAAADLHAAYSLAVATPDTGIAVNSPADAPAPPA